MSVRSISEPELIHHLPPDSLRRRGTESTMGSGVSKEFTWLPEAVSKFGGQQSAGCLE